MKPHSFSKIHDFFQKLNPFKKNYNKMVHEICVEVSEKKVVEIFFTLPLSQRDNFFSESFDNHFIITKSD